MVRTNEKIVTDERRCEGRGDGVHAHAAAYSTRQIERIEGRPVVVSYAPRESDDQRLIHGW